MTDLPKISHSQTDSFLLCERKHFYSYGMEIQRIAQSDSLTRGSLMHLVLEYDLNLMMQHIPRKDITSQTKLFLMNQMNGSNSEEVDKVADMYSWYVQADPFKDYTILAVEKEFFLPVGDKFQFQFKVDAIVRDPRGRMAVVDHKTAYDFYTERQIDNSPQIPKYIGGLRALGHKIEYGIYHQLRTRNLKTPTLSDMIKMQVFTPTDARIKQTFSEQITAAHRILAVKEKPLGEWSGEALRVNNALVCKSCSFNSLCVAELNDNGTNLILRSEYAPKEKRP